MGWIATGIALALWAAPSAATSKPQTCGPSNAATIAGNSQVRVYRQAGKGTASIVFGCVRGSRKTSRIGPIPPAGRKAVVHGPITVNGKWVAAVEERPDGATGWRVYVTSRNAGTSKGRHCLIGSGDSKSKAPAVRVVLMNANGGLAWAAITPTPNGRAPIIGACDSQGNRVLDSGAGVEIKTLELHGSTVSWENAGGPRTARLH